jgi:steroid 5-alpha reductase family enzyme
MSFVALLGLAAAATVVGAVALWTVSLAARDASLADRFWGPGFVVVAVLGAAFGAGAPTRRLVMLALVAVWGLRLGWHIHRRNRGHGEDPRYAAMRTRHGERFGRVSLVTVFLLQAALLVVVALPLVAAAAAPEPAALGALDAAAIAVWLAGFLCEAVGDAQLARFKADPANRGRVLDRGLWRYTRHPNYFGDALLWWGLFLFAGAVGAWWTAVGPALMTLLLRRVSGVTLLEKALLASRPGYAEYVARTSPFLPWPPKRAAG